MKVVVDPNLTVDDIVRSIEEADQYEYFGGKLGYNDVKNLTTWLGKLNNFDGTLMEVMMHCNYELENISVSFYPTQHGYFDGVGMIKLGHPTLLFTFEGLTTSMALIETPDRFYITMDYVAYGQFPYEGEI